MDQAEIERRLGGPPRVRFEDILNNPRLPDARKLYLDRFLDLYGGDPFLVRLLIQAGRFTLCNLTLVLEASQDPERRETWLTVGLLKRTMSPLGLASGRQVDHLIARLCAVGFMDMLPSKKDRRVRILRPTETLRAHDRDWLAAHYAPLTVLFPEYDYGLAMRKDPAFQTAHRRTAMQYVWLGIAVMQAMPPDMMLFYSRAGGYAVIAAILHAAMAEPDQLHAAVPYGDVGDRFGISRTHVRKLLIAAEEAGLVKLSARGGHRVEILPRFWSNHDRGIAGGIFLHDVLYEATVKNMAAAKG